MWILAGGSAEVASAFKKKRFLQKSLQDLFQNKTPLPDGMTIHFANTELARLNKKYSSQFKDLLGVKNTSDVIRRGLAEDMARAALLLGKQPKREREAGEFSYIDEHHIGHDDDPYYGILDEDGKNINNLFGEKAESDSEEEEEEEDEKPSPFDLQTFLTTYRTPGPSPISSNAQSRAKAKYQAGSGKKIKKRGQKLMPILVPSFRQNKI